MGATPHDARRHGRPWFERIPAGPLGAVATIVLGLLAALLVLVAIPRAFGIESSCVGPTGVESSSGDTYIAAFVTVGTLGWLATFLGMLLAGIAERRDVLVLLPVVWFLALVLTALGIAAIFGPMPCPS